MNSRVADVKKWLLDTSYPLWIQKGIDHTGGGFFEALNHDTTPAQLAQRTMVQARQIYSFRLAEKIGALSQADADRILRSTTDYLIAHVGREDGSFAHAIGIDRKISNESTELYTQAFVLFALAQTYSLTRDEKYKTRAKKLMNYLNRERRAPGGGYTEIKEGKTLYQSNPHMHLFEASIAWMATDTDPEWQMTADQIVELLLHKFIDEKTGALCEHFSENWIPERPDGQFIFEPGHHFEWCWLLGNYQALTGEKRLESVRHTLYNLGEKHGIHPERGVAMDEIWSNFTVKKYSSRFWPQTERIKAAVQLATEAPAAHAPHFAKLADDAVSGLFQYFNHAHPGLWWDTWMEDGSFTGDPVKASSLYHIAGAMAEYLRLREKSGGV